MGVIESLSAGYRVLGRRFDLLVVPLVLDVLLWLAPRLSLAPLLRRFVDMTLPAGGAQEMPADIVEINRQFAELMEQLSENSNLLSALVNSSLLHVPSLLGATGIVGDTRVVEITHPLGALMLFIGFGLLGVLIGIIYLNQLVRLLPLGNAPKAASAGEFVQAVLRHWFMMLLYIVLIFFTIVLISLPVALATVLVTLVSPLMAPLLLIISSGAITVIIFYLYFVTAAVVMDNLPVHRAVAQSFVLVRSNFWSTLGFVVLYNLISLGFATLMDTLAQLNPAATLVAILAYAYIGTGLTLALLVFYRTRILKQEERTRFTSEL